MEKIKFTVLNEGFDFDKKDQFTLEEQAKYKINESGDESDGKNHWVHCSWCGTPIVESTCIKEKDLGRLCPKCAEAIKASGSKLSLIDEEIKVVNVENPSQDDEAHITFDCSILDGETHEVATDKKVADFISKVFDELEGDDGHLHLELWTDASTEKDLEQEIKEYIEDHYDAYSILVDDVHIIDADLWRFKGDDDWNAEVVEELKPALSQVPGISFTDEKPTGFLYSNDKGDFWFECEVDSLKECLKEEKHVCEKCGKEVCECDKTLKEEELPPAEPTEPIKVDVTPEAPVDPEIKTNAIYGIVSNALQSKFNEIDSLKSLLVTLQAEGTDDDVLKIVNAIIDEDSIHLGMFQKALEIINPKESTIMDAGVEKAEDIISEPAADLDIKEGAEGHRVPGKEYVIYEIDDEAKKAPIVAIRKTYTEAQWYCNKPENFTRELGIEEVPEGKFKKGDDFWGPFDGEWNLVEASSAEKNAYKDGGQRFADYIQGKAIARIKDKDARDAAITLAKSGNPKVDRFIGDRKEDQAERAWEKKAQKMQKAGLKEE